MDIYLVRHTRVDLEAGICYGQTDISVSDSFETECEQLQAKLSEFDAGIVYSSPLKRCRVLAKRLQAREIYYDHRLLELNFGQWELQRWDSIDARTLKKWTANIIDERCPGGESFREQFERVVNFWRELSAKTFTQICIVTHGGVIRALLTFFLEIPLQNAFRLAIDFGSVTKVHFVENVPVVEYMNR